MLASKDTRTMDSVLIGVPHPPPSPSDCPPHTAGHRWSSRRWTSHRWSPWRLLSWRLLSWSLLSWSLLTGCRTVTHVPPAPPVQTPELLRERTALFKPQVQKVTDGIYVAIGYGIANSALIVAPEGRIVVDTLETFAQAKQVRAAFDALDASPIKAIIYTHSHPDHIFGAGAFDDGGTPVYAHADATHLMDELVSRIRPIMNRRAALMYGTSLKGTEFENVGIGPFVGMFDADATLDTRRPTHTYVKQASLTLAGEPLELLHAPGETADQTYVWLPKRKVLFAGDNLYEAFPNLYTLRGTSWRNPVAWVASLDLIRQLEPEHLVLSHTRFISGKAEIQRIVTDYRDAIQYVHDQTLRGMNQGLSPDELASRIVLPPHLLRSPYLQELYGSVPWCVRAIYSGYLGWFDGNPKALRPLAPELRAQKLIALAGGEAALLQQLEQAAASQDWAWLLELADALWLTNPTQPDMLRLRGQALQALGAAEGNPNARHWYLGSLLEQQRGTPLTLPNKPSTAFLHAVPTRVYFEAQQIALRAEETLELEKAAVFRFPDTGEVFSLTIRRGVAELREGEVPNAQLHVTVDSRAWKEMLGGLRNPLTFMASSELKVEEGVGAYADFMRHFRKD